MRSALAQQGTADRTLEIVELHHRLASDLVPVLAPLLGEGSVVTGTGAQLIIRARPEEWQAIQTVIARLDRPIAQFLITVRTGIESYATTHTDGAAGHVGIERAATGAEGSASVRVHTLRTEGNDDTDQMQYLRVSDGQSAFIQSGRDIPLANRTVTAGPYGLVVQDTISYRPVGAGFLVTPHASGDVVRLEITPWLEQMSADGGGAVATRQTQTALTAQPGEWVELAGAIAGIAASADTTLARTRRRDDETMRVWLRIDPAP